MYIYIPILSAPLRSSGAQDGGREPVRQHIYIYLHTYIYIYIYMHIYIYLYIYLYICINIYMSVCVYVCVCVNVPVCIYIYTYTIHVRFSGSQDGGREPVRQQRPGDGLDHDLDRNRTRRNLAPRPLRRRSIGRRSLPRRAHPRRRRSVASRILRWFHARRLGRGHAQGSLFSSSFSFFFNPAYHTTHTTQAERRARESPRRHRCQRVARRPEVASREKTLSFWVLCWLFHD